MIPDKITMEVSINERSKDWGLGYFYFKNLENKGGTSKQRKLKSSSLCVSWQEN
jgi:hypothetical protein